MSSELNNYPSNSTMIALLLMLVSTAGFAVMTVSIRQLSSDMSSVEIVFLRNLVCTLILIPLVLHHGVKELKTDHAGLHFWRNFIGIIGMELWFYGLAVLPINVATALSFTAPLITTLIAVLFYGERIGMHRVMALFVGFGGVIVILRPTAEASLSAMSIVLLATVFWAVSSNIVKSLTHHEPPWKIIFIMSILMTIFSAPISLLEWSNPTFDNWLWILVISVFGLVAHFAMVAAFARADMVTLMPLDFMRLVFIAILAYFFLGENLDIYSALGAAVVMSSAIYIAWRERRRRKLANIDNKS